MNEQALRNTGLSAYQAGLDAAKWLADAVHAGRLPPAALLGITPTSGQVASIADAAAANRDALQRIAQLRQQQDERLDSTKDGSLLRSAEVYAKKGVGNIAPLAAGAGLAPFTGGASLPVAFGLSAAADTYGADIAAGKSPAEAAEHAGLSGGLNAALGIIPGHLIAKPFASPLLKAGALALSNEAISTAAAPAQMAAEQATGMADYTLPDYVHATTEAAKTSAAPSLLLSGLGAYSPKSAGDRIRDLTDQVIGKPGEPPAQPTFDATAPPPTAPSVDDLAARRATANEILSRAGDVPPEEQAIAAGADAAAVAFDAAGVTPKAPQTEPQAIAPIPPKSSEIYSGTSAPELIRDGTRVLYRGDTEAMQAKLDAAGLPAGHRLFENGQPAGVYFPVGMQAQVDAVLRPQETTHATQTGIEPEGHQPEHPPGSPVGPATAAGGGNRAVAGAPLLATETGTPAQVGTVKLPEIEAFPGLTPKQRGVENRARAQVLADPAKALADYQALPGTDGGRIISADEAREIFPDYNEGPEARSRNAVAVHEPASAVAKLAWQAALDKPPSGPDAFVLFTGGGTGAGKTTGMSRVESMKNVQRDADAVYDGNLQSESSAVKKIEQALTTGRKVKIVYTFRDPVEAFVHGALPRAERANYGRTVPIPVHVGTHVGAAETYLALKQRYADNPSVSVEAVGNAYNPRTGASKAESLPDDTIPKDIAGRDRGILTSEVRDAFERERQAGNVSDRVYHGTLGTEPGRSGTSESSTVGVQARPEAALANRRGDDRGGTRPGNGPPAEPAVVPTAPPSGGTEPVAPTNSPKTLEGQPTEHAAQSPSTGDLTLQNRDRGRAASVAQMAGIAKAPDASRLAFARDPNNGAPMVSADDAGHAVPEADMGRADHVAMVSGRKIPVRYAVVEADSLEASHHADGTVNPAYPEAKLKALNNGRVAGLKAAWRNGHGEGYRAGLMDEADMLGIPKEAIAAKRQPVLIRLYDASHNRGDMGAESNATSSLGLSPTEQAMTDARALPDLSSLPVTDSGELSTNPATPFYRDFLRGLGGNEAAKLVDAEGRPNKTFFDRLRAAVFAKAYGSPRMIAAMAEDADPDARNVLHALVKAAPGWAKVDRDQVLGDYPDGIAAAFDVLRAARESGHSVDAYLKQGDLIGRDTSGDRWAQFFAAHARSPNKLAEGLKAAASLVEQQQAHAASGDFFGGGKLTADEITERAIRQVEERHGQAQQADLLTANGRAAPSAGRSPDRGGDQRGESGAERRAAVEEPVRPEPADASGPELDRTDLGSVQEGETGTPLKSQRTADHEPGEPLPLAKIATAVQKAFGSAKILHRLLARGSLQLVTKAQAVKIATDAAIKSGKRPPGPHEFDGVKGFHDGHHGYIITDEVRPDEVAGTILHEVGVHHTMETILGKERFAALQRRMAQLRNRGDKDVVRAYEHVPDDTAPEHVNHEAIAYLAEDAPNHPIAKHVLDATKLFLNRLGIPLSWLKGESAAINKITRESLLAEARGEGGPVLYRGGDTLYQKVFHGTPHRGIEKEGFKLNKIGTGEGNQAYGWGVYFAGNRAVADWYREMLPSRHVTYAGVNVGHMPNSPRTFAIKILAGSHGNKNIAEQRLREYAGSESAIKALHDLDPMEIDVRGSQLYHAEIPENDVLLDWDKPLSEQPPKVREALRHAGRTYGVYDSDATGRDLYGDLTDEFDDSPRRASEYLNSIGIPGLRYLDGGSRGQRVHEVAESDGPRWIILGDPDAGQFSTKAEAEKYAGDTESHNYVLWDENLLTPEQAKITPLYSRRIFQRDQGHPTERDYIVPETPEYAGNDSGDLAYTPRSAVANGIEQLPVRLTVGTARGAHSGRGILHIADEADRNQNREAPSHTDDRAENFARQVTTVARDFSEIYTDDSPSGGRIILRSPRLQQALVVERRTDPHTQEPFYSVVTLRPAEKSVWGEPVWRAGRGQAPADRLPQPGASDRSPDRESQQSDRTSHGGVQTGHFDLATEQARKQAPTVTVKRRRTFPPGILKSERATTAGVATDQNVAGTEVPRAAGDDDPRLRRLLEQYAGEKGAPSEPELRDAVRQYRDVEHANADVLRDHDENGTPLPAPNGQPSKLNRENWILTRTPNFGKWFGDWRLAALKDHLRAITGGDRARRTAVEFIGKPLVNADTGIEATVSRGSLNKMLSLSAARNSISPQAHAMAVANLDKLFPLAIRRLERPDNASNTNITALHHFDVPMPFDGDVLRVKMLVKETADPNQPNPLYTVAAIEIGKAPASERGDADSLTNQARLPTPPAGASVKPASERGKSFSEGVRSPTPPAGFDDRFAQMVAAVKGDGVSAVRDPETGEPSVVYHSGSFDETENAIPEIPASGFHFGTRAASQMRDVGKRVDDELASLKVEQDENEDGEQAWFWKSDNFDSFDIDPKGFDSEADARREAESEIANQDFTDSEEMPVTSAFISLLNPMRTRDNGADWVTTVARAKADGHDGIVYRNQYEDAGSTSYIAFRPGQVKSATANAGTFSDRPDIRFSRRAETKEAYDQRIDELFAGAKPRESGVKVLDHADIVGLLDGNDGPLHVVEKKVLDSTTHHGLTKDDWRKIPDWIDRPVAVFDSETVPGRLVAIAPELRNGAPIRMVIEPGAHGTEVHLLVNAYDAHGRSPMARWLDDGLLRYADQKIVPGWLSRSGLRLPGLLNPARGRNGIVKTGRDLVKYRAERGDLMRSVRADTIRGDLDQGQKEALAKIGVSPKVENFQQRWAELTDRASDKMVQGMVDQFAPLKNLDMTAYMQARLSKGTDGALEAVFLHGSPKLEDGALAVDPDGKGLRGILADLQGEHDVFLAWVAGNRAGELAKEWVVEHDGKQVGRYKDKAAASAALSAEFQRVSDG